MEGRDLSKNAFIKKFDIGKGDTVTIKAMGRTVTGKAISANFFGEQDGWYIELTEANVPGGYSYYKQSYDGGNVIAVETLWEQFLNKYFCHADPMTGNRLCDSYAGVCDRCNSDSADRKWQNFQAANTKRKGK